MSGIPSTADVAQGISDTQTTFSSWEGCMSKSYCKWPAIIGIIIVGVVVFSVIWCCARCLCCGMECCCGCLSCCNRCCPSPRGGKNHGYQQPPAQPYQNQQPPAQPYQYQSAPQPMYGAGARTYGEHRPAQKPMGYQGAQTASFDTGPKTATFDTGPKTTGAGANYNEDALPAMPSWQQATSKHELVEEDVEMTNMQPNGVQQGRSASPAQHPSNASYYGDRTAHGSQGRIATPVQPASGNAVQDGYAEQTQYGLASASGHRDPYAYQNQAPHGGNGMYAPPGQAYDMPPAAYGHHHQAQYDARSAYGSNSSPAPLADHPGASQTGIYNNYPPQYTSPSSPQPSTYPPTYRTEAPSTVYEPYGANEPRASSVSPTYPAGQPAPPQQAPASLMPGGGARKPVQNSWREV